LVYTNNLTLPGTFDGDGKADAQIALISGRNRPEGDLRARVNLQGLRQVFGMPGGKNLAGLTGWKEQY